MGAITDMGERLVFIKETVKEVLGPRGGAREVIEFRPDDDGGYITGWLAPYKSSIGLAEDGDREILLQDDGIGTADEPDGGNAEPAVDIEDPPEIDAGGSSGSEDQDAGPQVAGRVGQQTLPSLEPGRMPSTMGISFLAKGDRMHLSICATWARYAKLPPDPEDPGRLPKWGRTPKGIEMDLLVEAEAPPPINLGDGPLWMEFRLGPSRPDGTRTISVFLINRAERTGVEARTPLVVFQPQLRILLGEGTSLEHWPDLPSARSDEDADRLRLLYADRPIRARGHLCGAVWRDVDPEGTLEELEGLGIPLEHPFVWQDGKDVFGGDAARRFTRPDLRTEFVPSATVLSPLAEWDLNYGPKPALGPWELSKCVDPDRIGAALDPLPAAYEAWTNDRKMEVAALAAGFQPVARENLAQCGSVIARIREGIRILKENDDARLAFCFANQAMGIQSSWARAQKGQAAVPYDWRPFQLAFLLMEIPSILDRSGKLRHTCDLLWFPTGGGKTEAYLVVAAFVMAWRRLTALRKGSQEGYGLAVLSRYTLRLLTIQQFRRALALATACEFLRVTDWLPDGRAVKGGGAPVWGTERFGIGLWVGSSVTPSHLFGTGGALEVLQGMESRDGADPAQVLACPCCGSTLAVTLEQLRPGTRLRLHWVCNWTGLSALPDLRGETADGNFRILNSGASPLGAQGAQTLSLEVEVLRKQELGTLQPMTALWEHVEGKLRAGNVAAFLLPCLGKRPDRPGYFIREGQWGRMHAARAVDFEIICPSPDCQLGIPWRETRNGTVTAVPNPYSIEGGGSSRIPIPAATVDGQVYGRCPSMLVATVDKFAMLPFRPEAASLFGYVDRFDPQMGYWRSAINNPKNAPAVPVLVGTGGFLPPDLVLQDELHLIEGPLGSMVGLYETALDLLMARWEGTERTFRPLHLASSATVRAARQQVQSLFNRSICVFPPPGIRASDSFFAKIPDGHPLDPRQKGRVYLGICAPGSSPMIPPRNLWSLLLQAGQDREGQARWEDLDGFWTVVNYYNAIRELAGSSRMVAQDVQERLGRIKGRKVRLYREEGVIELSSRTDSLRLPGLLDALSQGLDQGSGRCLDMLHTTSMFGTGVDVPRLSLMIVHGQPKTASAYIQATGRVGREAPGLLITLHRSGRPRDLSHYEFFTGFHGALYRYVEPITLAPFSPRAMERALGPIGVMLLRLAPSIGGKAIPAGFRMDPNEISASRTDSALTTITGMLEQRSQDMPAERRPPAGECRDLAEAMLDLWKRRSDNPCGLDFAYNEWTIRNPARRMVVLGDEAHREVKPPSPAGAAVPTPVSPACAFLNTPTSMREVEATTAFGERVEAPPPAGTGANAGAAPGSGGAARPRAAGRGRGRR